MAVREIQSLQENRRNIRNICILAHVDHGKTTLADALVASNGIISPRMVGKLRYMDSREDEQQRGITMKSSAIALHFETNQQNYLVNLIDSPGHVDFSSEVSTAVRLCDGALIVVDVLEGVCPQTQVVLQQAWREGIKPCLVLNKIDRLIVERKLTPMEAYMHLQQLLEQVNAITGTLFTSDVLESTTNRQQQQQQQQKQQQQQHGSKDSCVSQGEGKDGEEESVFDWSSGLEEQDDSSLYFYPDQENIIFASAIDGWGFGIGHFAQLYAKKLGVREEILRKTLWGDFFLNTKTKRIYKGAQAKGKKPLFVQFILENIWAVYDAVVVNRNKEKIEKITSTLKLKVSMRDSKNSDSRTHLYAICSQWLPLAQATLEMVVNKLPSPLDIGEERVEKLMCEPAKTFDSFPPETQALKKTFLECSTQNDVPVIAYISKMFPFPQSGLPDHRTRPLNSREIEQRHDLAKLRAMAKTAHAQAVAVDDVSTDISVGSKEVSTSDNNQGVVFIAFARIFAGTLTKGQQLFVIHPRYDPRESQSVWNGHFITPAEASQDPSVLPEHVTVVTVSNLYVLMGRCVEEVAHIGAGNVVGIGGLEGVILKSATLSSTYACPAFRPMSFAATPIVEVAIDPYHSSDMQALRRGMELLNQADPCVRITISLTGEHILATAGEVHLQRCLDDLKTTYAKVKLSVSAPIIPFRETVVLPPKVDMVNEAISGANEIKRIQTRDLGIGVEVVDEDRTINIMTSNRLCMLEILARPLPDKITALLENNRDFLRILSNFSGPGVSGVGNDFTVNQATLSHLAKLREELTSAFEGAGPIWKGCVDCIWSFGPRHTGPNILINQCQDYNRPSIWSILEGKRNLTGCLREYDNSILNGFQLASLAGPLCEEPLYGVCFFLKKWKIHSSPLPMKKMAVPSSEDEVEPLNKESNSKEQSSNSSRQPSSTKLEEHESDSSLVQTSESLYPSYASLGGQLISAVKEGCRKALLAQPIRLMLAMYKCKVQASSDVLGRMYSVLSRRQGRVLSEQMKEGSNLFEIDAVVPVAESFGFAEEIRKKTSGLASPQLMFSHWEKIQMDPFWVPSTEEELTHYGEKADTENTAQKYMKAVRRRKGLFTEDKLVEHAEKQRTLKK